jgi:EF-P beta-lysylation protein EpmB
LPPWQAALQRAVRDPRELCRRLRLDAVWAERAVLAARSFALLVPEGFLARMRPGDPCDPLLRQVLPLDAELCTVPGYVADPVGDVAANCEPGLLHKYAGRTLLVTTGACAVHCRYCFRRHFPYRQAPRRLADWEPALERIAADVSQHEVILSGGDPWMLPDETLAALAEGLAGIPHLRRLRVHTRMPIVLPERVCDELLSWLCGTRLTPVVVVHANHPAELDDAVAAALGRLVGAGVPVLNQCVLLAGVNDDADVLAELCERLVDLRVVPYYLHQLDRVAGAAHFEVPAERGRQLIAELRRLLPGYAVPRYVQELPGAEHKLPLA